MYRILIIEDDEGIAQAIQKQASKWALDAKCLHDFKNVLADFKNKRMTKNSSSAKAFSALLLFF